MIFYAYFIPVYHLASTCMMGTPVRTVPWLPMLQCVYMGLLCVVKE